MKRGADVTLSGVKVGAVTGFTLDPKAVHWYKVYNDYMMATLLFATGYRIANGGKTHQDVLITWLMGIGNTLLEEMRTLIEEAP